MDNMNYLLLEAYCLLHFDKNKMDKAPPFCPLKCDNKSIPAYQCLSNRCQYLDYTSCENAFCFIDAMSEMKYGIMLGKEISVRQQELWGQISLKKIDEAYDELMAAENLIRQGDVLRSTGDGSVE